MPPHNMFDVMKAAVMVMFGPVGVLMHMLMGQPVSFLCAVYRHFQMGARNAAFYGRFLFKTHPRDPQAV